MKFKKWKNCSKSKCNSRIILYAGIYMDKGTNLSTIIVEADDHDEVNKGSSQVLKTFCVDVDCIGFVFSEI